MIEKIQKTLQETKIVSAFVLLATSLLIVVGVCNNNLQEAKDEYSLLHSEKESIELNYTELQDKYFDLEQEYSSLENKYAAVLEEKKLLESQINEYKDQQATIDDLNAKLIELQSQYDALKADRDSLQVQVDAKKAEQARIAQEQANQQLQAQQSNAGAGTVYWTPGGSVYHSNSGCPTLQRSNVINSGSISESGKGRACKVCS